MDYNLKSRTEIAPGDFFFADGAAYICIKPDQGRKALGMIIEDGKYQIFGLCLEKGDINIRCFDKESCRRLV
jgi:hypothetical protein